MVEREGGWAFPLLPIGNVDAVKCMQYNAISMVSQHWLWVKLSVWDLFSYPSISISVASTSHHSLWIDIVLQYGWHEVCSMKKSIMQKITKDFFSFAESVRKCLRGEKREREKREDVRCCCIVMWSHGLTSTSNLV